MTPEEIAGYESANPDLKKVNMTLNWPKIAVGVGILALLGVILTYIVLGGKVNALQATQASSSAEIAQITGYLEEGINVGYFPQGSVIQQRAAQMQASSTQ